ncbi:MAG: Osmosensitive channel His kinase sensor [Paenibacillus sp.]|nr:Osmosensitive channel His kinase sensor [Paenibacillus sp.]
MKQRAYFGATIAISAMTYVLLQWLPAFDLVNVALLYLLPALLSAAYGGKGPSLYAATLGLLAFDFFFVPPFFSFAVSDLRYVFTFVVYYIVAVMTASLAARLKQQLLDSKRKEAYTASLFAVSKEMSSYSDIQSLLRNVSEHVSLNVDTPAVIYLPDAQDELTLAISAASPAEWGGGDSELAIADWVYRHGRTAGKGTPTLNGSPGLYLPLRTEDRVHGVLGVKLGDVVLSKDRRSFLEALAGLAAIAIARVKLGEEAKIAQLTADSERLRTAILDSVSHELRTPLATMIGSATAMIENDGLFTPQDRMELLGAIREGALRMNRLVSNLLGMVQLESGMLRLRQDWCDVEDMISVVLKQVRDFQQRREMIVRLPEQNLLIPGDEVLLEQVLTNVVSNAIKYSPDGSTIEISVAQNNDYATITVADEGIGIDAAVSERVFDKFFRSARTQHLPGTGLGLAICKGIVELHGGSISAAPNGTRGTIVSIALPVTRQEPAPRSHEERSAEQR